MFPILNPLVRVLLPILLVPHRIVFGGLGVVLLLAGYPLLAVTGPIRITDYRQAYPIDAQAEVLHAPATSQTIGRYWNAFTPLDLQELILGNAADNVYWFRFSVHNQTDQHLYAMLTNAGYAHAELYEWDGRQAHRLAVGGVDAPSRELYMRRATAIMPLNLLPGQQKTYLLRTQPMLVKQNPVILYAEYALLASTQVLDVLLGLALAGLLTAFLHVLVSYWLTREASYGWLAAQILPQLMQHLFVGLLSGYVDLPDWVSFFYLYHVFIALSGIASRQFQCHLLQVETYGNRFIRVGYRVHLAVYLVFLGAAVMNQPAIFDYVVPISLLLYFFVLYSNWVVYRNGYKPALYLLLTQLLPLLGLPLLFLQKEGIIAGGIDYSAIPLVVISYSGYALTLGYKVRLFKDEAQALIIQQNQNLEHLIVQRTQALQAEKNRADLQSERLRLALRELNHRVRNNLAVVSSLLKLQSNTTSNTTDPQKSRDAFQESRQRVDAMALIHQQLYQSEEVTTIDVPTFITHLTTVLSEAYGYTPHSLQMELALEPLILPVEKAVPLGLLLNEVLTNAFKYGLPQAKKPCLTLTMRQEEALFLEIRDNGPGIDPAVWQSKSASFGRRLIDGLTLQLDGTSEVSVEAGGCFRFWLPITQELTTFV